MTKYFTGVKTVEELRKRYRELLRKYHPDNKNGSTEITQQINAEYDRLFAILSDKAQSDSQSRAEFSRITFTSTHCNPSPYRLYKKASSPNPKNPRNPYRHNPKYLPH